jgi:hypothetical protein
MMGGRGHLEIAGSRGSSVWDAAVTCEKAFGRGGESVADSVPG